MKRVIFNHYLLKVFYVIRLLLIILRYLLYTIILILDRLKLIKFVKSFVQLNLRKCYTRTPNYLGFPCNS